MVNYEYCGTVRLDPCGDVVWALDERTHHSVVPAEAGGYWALGREPWPMDDAAAGFPPVSSPPADDVVQDDTVLRIGEDGDVLDEFSITELMRDNGLEAVLTANGTGVRSSDVHGQELLHANKVSELPSGIADAYPRFDAGTWRSRCGHATWSWSSIRTPGR